MIKYKVVTIGCLLSTKRMFSEDFQEVLDEYSKKGFRLHSFKFANNSSFCTIVFEKDEEEF